MTYKKYIQEDDRDYRYEVGKLADYLLSNGYGPSHDEEGAVDCAIRVLKNYVNDDPMDYFCGEFKD